MSATVRIFFKKRAHRLLFFYRPLKSTPRSSPMPLRLNFLPEISNSLLDFFFAWLFVKKLMASIPNHLYRQDKPILMYKIHYVDAGHHFEVSFSHEAS